ncbi:MAG TPA: branched chain amino acid aminotransferase [Cytophagales bacterium]|jgi:branched-chain amino acid aminotransferase|nr:branched chain amino acid aminotransferase [Cytophagales bacterium]
MVETAKIKIRKKEQSSLPQVDFSNIVFGRVFSDHMFVADYRDGEWEDLRIEPYEAMQLTPGLISLHYAQTIFEGLKAYKNDKGDVMVFRPEMNLKRLNISAERMCMPQLPEDIYMQGLSELLRLDRNWVPNLPNTALYIRPFMFGTDEYIGLKSSETYRFIIFTCPVGAYYSKPVKVKFERHFTRAAKGGTGFAKTGGNYAGSLYPAKLAQEKGYDQLIWTDGIEHEYVEEAGTMNIMFVIGDTLITPHPGDSVLKGITRDSVLTLARDWGMKVEERRIKTSEIVEAIKNNTLKEAFGVGTAATIAHISLIADDETDYPLPPVESREFSNKALKALDDIKTGVTEDKFNWIYKL